jgi:hypothetical protein
MEFSEGMTVEAEKAFSRTGQALEEGEFFEF